jgi:hypothetical protein
MQHISSLCVTQTVKTILTPPNQQLSLRNSPQALTLHVMLEPSGPMRIQDCDESIKQRPGQAGALPHWRGATGPRAKNVPTRKNEK